MDGEELGVIKARYEAIKEASLDAFYLFECERDEGGRIIDFIFVDLNTRGAALLKRETCEELLGQRLSVVRPNIRSGPFWERYIRVVETREPIEEELPQLSPETAAEWMANQVVAVGDGIAVTVRDITALRRAQQRLRLAERMASVGTLAAGLAHEINNPLAFIVLNLEFVAESLASLRGHEGDAASREALAREAEEAITNTREGVERVRRIVRDLTVFSRAETLALEAVDIHKVLDSCVQMAHNELRHRARVERRYGSTPRVSASAGRLGQVFLNLLMNAAQAIPEGQADRNEVVITTSTSNDGRVVVEIQDSGQGMSVEVIAQIFDPFFTTKRIGEGMGLGLYICYGIVTSIGGEIQVESELGKGSLIRVFLPAAPAPEPAPAPPPAPSARRRARVLLIDDESLVVLSMTRMIGARHDVEKHTSARAALARIEAGERYDVILCDLMMPEITGMDLHERLSLQVPDQAARCVFITGGAFTPRARAFLERSPNPHLMKPFDREALLGAIDRVLLDPDRERR